MLGGNELQGEIPTELGNVPSLEILCADAVIACSSMVCFSLICRSLYSNKLEGEIPKELFKLFKLQQL